jgi:Ca2+:H+ antiporter
MDLDFKLIETGSLFVSVIVTAFTLQVHTHTYYILSILITDEHSS